MIDFHCHCLAGMDDGAKSVEESVSMLELLKEQNVSDVVATPHFVPGEMNVDRFLEKRRMAFESIRRLCPSEINIILGAEVFLSPELMNMDDVSQLCIGKTRCILIEMPFQSWQQWMFDIIEDIRSKEFIPIIAHAERYAESLSLFKYSRFFEKGLMFMQFNSLSFLNRFGRKVILELLGKGAMPIIGSDAHNLKTRKPCIDKAVKVIRSKFGAELLENIEFSEKSLLGAL